MYTIMLTSLKGKLQSAGLLHPTPEENPGKVLSVSLNAGSDILTYFQGQWEELHGISEQNAKGATDLAKEISNVHAKLTKSHKNLVDITQLLCGPPALNKSVDKCLEQLKEVYKTADTVEKGLINLETVIDRIELECKKKDHRHQLQLYKEKKMGNFEQCRSNLADKHTQNLSEKEVKHQKMLEERQKVFEEAFNCDLETYKSLGTIPKITTKAQPGALLEEIQLDLDQDDLENFLNSKEADSK